MPDKKYLFFAVAYVAFILFNTVFAGGRIGYDTARNEKIVTELVTYGTFTYFDVPFIVSPPLYYVIHSFPVAAFGTAQAVFKFTEATLYFLGALLAFLVVQQLGLPKKTGFLVFFLLLIDGQMFGIQAIDFWGAILLFSGLVLFFFVRLWKKPSFLSALGFGFSVGLSMLTKSSFIFLILPLVLVYGALSLARKDVKTTGMILLSLVIGVLIYSPWMTYLTSNGFPIITNPEAQGKLPWDPDFKGYSYEQIYWNAWIDYWPLLYPFSIIIGFYLIYEYLKSVRFETGVKLKGKLSYFYHKYRETGGFFASLLFVILTLPFFNRLLVGIPVGEQFLTLALASYMTLAIAFYKTRVKNVRILIAAFLVINVVWGFTTTKPVLASQEHEQICPLYTEFFRNSGPDKTFLVDEKISRVAYPAHNVLYRGFFEWFSYNENYDVARIITMNVDYIVLIDSERIPSYLGSGFFERQRTDNCEDLRGRPPYKTVVFQVKDRDGFARAAGMGEKAQVRIQGDGKPVQAVVTVTREGFNLEYKSKRDGSLTIYAPSNGTYTARVVRPGFRPKDMNVEIPGSGETLINLEKDSPFVTHTTANRY